MTDSEEETLLSREKEGEEQGHVGALSDEAANIKGLLEPLRGHFPQLDLPPLSTETLEVAQGHAKSHFNFLRELDLLVNASDVTLGKFFNRVVSLKPLT